MSKQLRLMIQDDLNLIREWRNNENIRKYMFSQDYISVEAHRKWFDFNQNHPLRKLLIYEENGNPLGFTQLKDKGENTHIYEWGFYISPEATKGTGTSMLKEVIHLAFDRFNALKIYGEVLDFNLSSIQLHQRLGFKEEGILRQHFLLNNKYHNVYCFGLLRGEFC